MKRIALNEWDCDPITVPCPFQSSAGGRVSYDEWNEGVLAETTQARSAARRVDPRTDSEDSEGVDEVVEQPDAEIRERHPSDTDGVIEVQPVRGGSGCTVSKKVAAQMAQLLTLTV